jgi:hypothetical protein
MIERRPNARAFRSPRSQSRNVDHILNTVGFSYCAYGFPKKRGERTRRCEF